MSRNTRATNRIPLKPKENKNKTAKGNVRTQNASQNAKNQTNRKNVAPAVPQPVEEENEVEQSTVKTVRLFILNGDYYIIISFNKWVRKSILRNIDYRN